MSEHPDVAVVVGGSVLCRWNGPMPRTGDWVRITQPQGRGGNFTLRGRVFRVLRVEHIGNLPTGDVMPHQIERSGVPEVGAVRVCLHVVERTERRRTRP